MKKTLIFIILVTLAFIGMQSCIYDEEPASTLPQGIQMGFTIHVAGNSTASRGADDKTEEGNDLENMIDIDNRDFKVYFYKTDENNTFIGELEVISVLDVTDNDANGYNNDYYVVGKVDENNVTALNAGFRMVVMANLNKWYKKAVIKDNSGFEKGEIPAYPTTSANENSLFSDSENYISYTDGQYRYHKEEEMNQPKRDKVGYYVTPDKLIPMWGIHTYNVTFEPNEITQLKEPINMLRAFAKIELMIDETSTGNCSLENVTMDGYRNQFFMQQAKEDIEKNDYKTNIDFETINNDDEGRYGNVDMKLYKESEKKYVIYIPEHKQETPEGKDYKTQLEFQIRFGDEKNPQSFTIPFSEKDDGTIDMTGEGKRFDILRNHIYRFKVKVENTDVAIWYQGVAWDEKAQVDINPGAEHQDPPTQSSN